MNPSMLDAITIRGARQHNLKGFDLEIPHRRFVVVTGVSGSGKSSLAFDTIYAEGQRRYVESLSTYARQFLDRMDKPDVDAIEGIAPAIAIEQKNPVKHSRSTVGTATEIATYLRLLYARVGRTVCPDCDREVTADTVRSATDALLAEPAGTRALVAFDRPLARRETWAAWAAARVAQGYLRVVLDGEPLDLSDPAALDRLEAARERLVVADRLVLGPDARGRLAEALEAAFREGVGTATVVLLGTAGRDAGLPGSPTRLRRFSARHACPGCGRTFEAPTPLLFSFNSPRGACPTCKGFGSTLDYAMDRIVPDPSKSLKYGAIDPWTKPSNDWWQRELPAFCRRAGIDAARPFAELGADEIAALRKGDRKFPGLDGFFAYLERKKYKMHVRVFMSRYKAAVTCADCRGTRLRPEARYARIGGKNVAEASTLTVGEARRWLAGLPLTPFEAEVARDVVRQIASRLEFLEEVGLDYLTLDRQTRTLSGGEAQRINLANQLGAALTGTLYVLDEPSVGLHPRDTGRLVAILRRLADAGNTVLVVEHDRELIEAADHVVELGPRSGEQGGRVVFAGPAGAFRRDAAALTPRYLRGELTVPVPRRRRDVDGPRITLAGARAHNLKGICVEIPLGTLTVVTGVSGSGKSTLVHDTLWAALDRLVNGRRPSRPGIEPEENGDAGERAPGVGAFDRLSGVERLGGAVLIDQSPIGRTPRSNPATYIKVWDDIRKAFAGTAEARRLGLTAGHFSFNVPGGRCATCEGAGYQTIEMHFLADVYVTCEACRGRRFAEAALAARLRGRTIADILEMTVTEAARFFADQPAIARRLGVLAEVGLGYLRLGQAATTLSGGEAQRLKIARELAGADGASRGVLYVMDEPTTGLHLHDVAALVEVLQSLVDRGNTLLVVEHHPDVIKAADWVIDLGPEGGDRGGEVVATGSPEEVAAHPTSHTGRALRGLLSGPAGGASVTGGYEPEAPSRLRRA